MGRVSGEAGRGRREGGSGQRVCSKTGATQGLNGQECKVRLDGRVREHAEGAGMCKVMSGRGWPGRRAARSAE